MLGGLTVPVLAQRVLARPGGDTARPARSPGRARSAWPARRRSPPPALAVAALETLGRPQVQADPSPDGDAPVEHLLVQGMNEGIPPRHRPIRPLGDADRAEELASARQRLASPLAFLRVDPGRVDDRRRELRARHAGGRQHRLLVRRQALDLLLHQLPQRLGVRAAMSSDRSREPPRPVDLDAAVPGRSDRRPCSPGTAGCRRCCDGAPAPAPPGIRARESDGRGIRPRRPRSGTRAGSRHSARAAAAPA